MVWEDKNISVKQAQISVFGSAFLFCDKMHELTNLLFREKLKGEKRICIFVQKKSLKKAG